jgi:hypothetical protein
MKKGKCFRMVVDDYRDCIEEHEEIALIHEERFRLKSHEKDAIILKLTTAQAREILKRYKSSNPVEVHEMLCDLLKNSSEGYSIATSVGTLWAIEVVTV